MQYCSFTASDLVSITSHIHNQVLFLLWLCLFILFLELFLHWSPVAYWAPTDLGSSSFSVLFAFSYCSWCSQGKNNELVCHSLLQWTTVCQTSLPWPSCLGWPHIAWLSFIELDKAVVRVIRLTSFLWLWFVSSLWCLSQHLPSYLGFCYLGRGVSLQGCSSKAQVLLLTLEEGYLLTAAPSDLERGVAPLGLITCYPLPVLITPKSLNHF